MSWQDNIVSIVIPTYKRPEGLARALASVEHSAVADHTVEIVIADNDPAGSAREFVIDFAKRSQASITYVHVPEPGVSNARNGALDVARGRYILFLDDDMTAAQNWAQILMDGARRFEATIAFGPVEAVMPKAENPLYAHMQPFFCRHLEQPDGPIPHGVATGNSFLDRKTAQLPTPVFDPALNQTGGEDDALFIHLMSRGARSIWINGARGYEHVPAHRATLTYVWRRNFAFGQGPTQEAADRGLKGLPAILKWMAVGMVQTGLYGLQWAFSSLLRQPRAVQYWARMAQGVGKVLWADRFSPKLYGI